MNENYLGGNLICHLDKGSFSRLIITDDYVRRSPDLYLFEDKDELDREIIAEALLAWKPTHRNSLFIGAKTGVIDN